MKKRGKRKSKKNPETFPNKIALTIVASLIIAAFFLRWAGINRDHQFTFDESVYQELGYQLYKEPSNYSPISVYLKLRELGRNAPEYLNQPLFKHPPLFSYLIASSISLLGVSVRSSYIVPVLFGALSLWIIFLIGRACYDRKTALIAALLLFFDPLFWICSEKIWLGTTQTFFLLSTLYLFLKGLNKSTYFLVSGICLGLALLTKYTSLLMIPTLFIFAIASRGKLSRNKYFWSLWASALVIFSPWLIWYYQVYGGFAGLESAGVKGIVILQLLRNLRNSLFWVIPSLAIIFALGWMLSYFLQKSNREKIIAGVKANKNYKTIIWLTAIPAAVAISLLSIRFYPFIKQVLSPSNLPEIGWERGLFSAEPIWFYFKRLPRFSPFYLIAFLGLAKVGSRDQKERLLAIYCLVILIFHSWWGNYQSRYIITVIPVLLLLCADLLIKGWRIISQISHRNKKIYLRLIYGGIILYFALKTIIVAINISFPNSGCYF